jgi:pyrroloquinoline quinone biosynthesis protein B
MNGPKGSLAALDGVKVGRRFYIHINNSNPVLCSGGEERRRVEAAGWAIAHDGLALDLRA